MEDMEELDYSSDRLESSDIWEVPGGGMMEQLVDIPSLGQDVVGSASLVTLGLETVSSSSDFLVFSPELLTAVSQEESFTQRSEVWLGSSNWREAGIFSSRIPEFQAAVSQEGFGAVKGNASGTDDGEVGQVLQGKVSSRETSDDEWRMPLDVAEQRGFGSPRRDLFGGGSGVSGDLNGRQAVESGASKKRRKNWIKKKQLRNYAVDEDIAWDNVLRMAKCTLVGRVLGRNFAKKTISNWATTSWGAQCGYILEVAMITRGWFAVTLEKEEDLRWIQNKSWHIDHSPVLLKP